MWEARKKEKTAKIIAEKVKLRSSRKAKNQNEKELRRYALDVENLDT